MMAVSKADKPIRDYFKNRDPAKRLVFCGHADYHSHIDRQQAADLALDTWPYNGHTTTSEQRNGAACGSDAEGTVRLTRSREPALNAMNTPNYLVANDAQAYEDMAVAL